MSDITNHSGDETHSEIFQLTVNMADFNKQDLQDFVDISEEIVRTTRERRSQRKRSKSCSNNSVATMTREGLFESIIIDDDQYLQALEHDTTYEIGKDRADLIRSLENIMKYFDEDVKVKDESNFKSLCDRKSVKGKVATAVASLRSKCGFAAHPLLDKECPANGANSNNIQGLRKKYENSLEADTTASPAKATENVKKDETKVKQLALLFNNINSKVRNSSTAQPTEPSAPNFKTISKVGEFSSELKPKLPKLKPKLSSPKLSPFLERKSLNNKTLEKQPATASLVAENIFSQLTVKDKVLLYNKFIADMTKENPQFSKHTDVLESNAKKGEVVFEKQNSVKYLRATLEAKLTPNKSPSTTTLYNLKKFNTKSPLDISWKSKESSDISQTFVVENPSPDSSQSGTLQVLFKPSPEAPKCAAQAKSQCKKKDVTFSENVTILEHSQKRSQSMICSPYRFEPFEPPRKIRHYRQERLEPKKFFQNPQLETLFYHWLKDKNGVAFDITATENKNNVTEIGSKNSSGHLLSPPQTVQKISEAGVDNLDSRIRQNFESQDKPDNPINIIQNTLQHENSLNKSVIEVELPLEHNKQDAKFIPNEESDSGLTGTNKTTSEDTQTELNSLDVSSNELAKRLRKKKLRRIITFKKETPVKQKPKISSTDSDSDCKAKNVKFQSLTFPTTTQPSINDHKMIFNRYKSSNEKNNSVLGDSKNYFRNSELDKIHFKEVSRSCPSLLETDLDADIGCLKDKSISEELTDPMQPKLLQEQHKLLMKNIIDQGLKPDLNEIISPIKLNIKKNSYKLNESDQKNMDNWFSFYNQQPAYTTQPLDDKYILTTPLRSNCTQRKEAYFTKTISKDGNNTAGSLDESPSCSPTSVPNSLNSNLNVTQKLTTTSQFWISSGDFTAAVTIYYHEPERLMLLSNIYAQKSMETKEMNFGIDDHKFCLDCNTTWNETIKQVPQKDNCSQYWFCTGDVLIPFKGPHLNAQKIQKFFNYIREFMEDDKCLRFGIDACEFSNIYQECPKSVTAINCSPWNQIASATLKTSDLDQSEPDSEDYGQTLTFSSVSSLEQMLRQLGGNEIQIQEYKTNYVNFKAADNIRESLNNIYIYCGE